MNVSVNRDRAWYEAVAARANDDPELKAIGRYFNATISITIDDSRHDLVVRDGRVETIRDVIKVDSRADFGFRAPAAVWDLHLQAFPPPLYQNIFSMIMRVPEFRLEGDTLVFAQNARAVCRLMSIMQTQGATV